MNTPAAMYRPSTGTAAAGEERGVPRPTLKFSIIMPVLNEAAVIVHGLDVLQPLREAGHEVIVVDGGSTDATVNLARPLADNVLVSTRSGRAYQMNKGARNASGDVLLFLHADGQLPAEAVQRVADALTARARGWGRFDLRLSGGAATLRVVEFMINLRSRLSGIATGDQAMFVRKPLFEAVGGFPAIALMEDVALSKRLKRVHRPICLKARVLASSRRWERDGIWRTVFLMWHLRLAYFFGADPQRLVRRYYSS